MKKLAFLLALLMLALASCARTSSYQDIHFFAMDTFAEVRAYASDTSTNDALISCKRVAEELENKISPTKEGSDTYVFNHGAAQECSGDFTDLLRLSLEISELTDGAFDIASGALIELWTSCEAEGRLPKDEELSAALSNTGYTGVQLFGDSVIKQTPGLWLNFGAIGKGYAADRMAEALRDGGVSCGMISFVSSVTVFGDKDFKIGIRRPDTSGELFGYVTLCDRSLSVSGDYERFYEIEGTEYPHILDPKTGRPVSNGIHSVVVLADSGAMADALSTAVFVMGVEKAATLYQNEDLTFEFLCMTDEGAVASDGFLACFEPSDKGEMPLSLSQYISER